MANDDQIEYWNGEAGDRWVAHADALDAMLEPFLPAILTAAGLQPGERVLDIGCGAGALSLRAAKAVGADGLVQGVDVSRPLVALATQRADAAGAAARFEVADASSWTADAPFDVLISRFGVMFFEDPVAAFGTLRAAMNPGGRLVFACWRPMMENDWARAPLMAALPALQSPPTPPPPEAPGPFAFGDRVRVEDILDAAGWTDLIVEPWDGGVDLPGRNAAEAARFMLELGPIGRLLAEEGVEPEPVIERLTALFAEKAAPGGGVRLDGAAWIVRARAK